MYDKRTFIGDYSDRDRQNERIPTTVSKKHKIKPSHTRIILFCKIFRCFINLMMKVQILHTL